MTDTVADAAALDDPVPDAGTAVPAPAPLLAPASGLGGAFRHSWLADLASGAGEGIRIGALPLLAAALDYSPGAVAAVWVAGGLPFIFVGPFSGVLSDRWRRYRRTMWVSDTLAAVAAALLAAAVLTHVAGIWTLVAFNLAVGSLATLRDNAATAIVPELVPAALLDRANSRVQTVQFLTIDLVGPPLGALLFTVARGAPFVLDALSFVVAAFLVFGLPRTPAPVPLPGAGDAGATGSARSVVAQMREGAGWLRRHRLLRSVCLIVGLQSLAVMSAVSVAVLYAYEVLGVGQRVYVALMAVIALGAVGGSLLAPVLSARLGRTAALRVALAFAPVAFAVAAVTSTPAAAAIALAFVGAAVGVGNVVSVSLRHALVPEDLRGRVNSSYRLVAVGMGPLGAALGGLSSEAFGLRAPMAVSAVASGTALVIALRSTRGPETNPGPGPETDVEPDAGTDGVVPRRRRLRRVLAGLLALAVLLPLLGAGYLGWTVRRSFPQVDGQLAVAGLQARVDVVRDRYGVPQISAGTSHDLFLAQGYVQAQDRFWQMDVARHVTAGRLAELFGADQVETDAVVRTLGWRRVAEAELHLLSPQTRALLDAYADGVNAYLATRQGAELSVEHAVLGVIAPGYRPEPWTAVDSVSWLKAMAWTLRGNDSEETQRALLSSALPTDRVEQLFPGYDFSTQRPIVAGTGTPVGTPTGTSAGTPAGAAAPAPSATVTPAGLSRVTAVLESTLGPSGPGIGSNSWVVSGSRTATGRPLLANDPHLGPALPSIWYQVGLHCRSVGPACPYDVAGVGFAPMPGVFIGHNADISWGLTNFGADVADLYLEQVTGDRYLYQGAMLPLTTRQEVIRVAGGKPVTITVSSTRHGPIISGVDKQARAVGVAMAGRDGARAGGGPLAVALRWTALDPSTTLDSVFALDRARDWTTFREAMRGFASPAQNVVYADRAGHIGYQAIGVVPVRSAGDGRYPVAGWTGTHEWVGTIPYDAMPRAFDPASGYIVTANNAAVGPGYPYLITADWPDGYRSERIAHLIETGGTLDAAAMRRIQQDTLNPMAAILVPYLLRVTPTATDRRAVDLLRTWDGTQPVDSAGAAYFNAVWRSLLRLAFTDDLRRTPADPDPSGGGRWLEVVRSLLTRPSDPWWADASDPRHLTTRDDVLRAALDDAAAELTTRLGPDPAHWRWGDLHRLSLENETLGQGPAPLQWLLNRGPYEVAGGNSAVDATGWDARDGYAVDWIPSMRMVVDVGAWDASGWVNASGASGHAGTGTYTDQTDDWVAGRTTAWPFSAPAVQAARVHALALVPAAP